MNALYIKRMETMKDEIAEALGKGTYADLPADEMGITPETRLQWGIDSLNYIAGVANSIEGINHTIRGVLIDTEGKNDDEILIAMCRAIEAQSGDCYVTEGIENIRWVIAILGPIVDEDAKGKKWKLFKRKQTPEEIEDEIRSLKITVALLEKQKAESEAREKVAKNEIRRLTMWLDFFERRSRRKT